MEICRNVSISVLLILIFTVIVVAAPIDFSLSKDGQTVLSFSEKGGMQLRFSGELTKIVWGSVTEPGFLLRAETKAIRSVAVEKVPNSDKLQVRFEDGSVALFRLSVGDGFVLFHLESLDAKSNPTSFEMGRLALPGQGVVDGTLNRLRKDGKFVAVSTGAISVRQGMRRPAAYRADREGCSHLFEKSEGREPGRSAARFRAECKTTAGGWSVQGIRFDTPIDLSGLVAIRVVVHGDGNGQSLKIQPVDSAGGARDSYFPIDFSGWKELTTAKSPHDKITKPDSIAGLNIYYNGIPAGKGVECLIERIEAIVKQNGEERSILLEDFSKTNSPWWSNGDQTLLVEATARHGMDGACFAVLAGDESDFNRIMPDFEIAAGLPSPVLDGVWNKISPDVKRSYFFLTNFKEPEFDAALEIAKRGGFDRILILQNSWTRATGHYEVNLKNFPEGLPALQHAVRKFRDAGFKTGFHFLAASIDPPDSYLTPKPDDRLLYGTKIELAEPVSATATFFPTLTAPEEFPEEDGGYMGQGQVLRIGDELIVYSKRKLISPFGFEDCRRGHLGTKAAEHGKGSAVRHLVRSYGYHMIDLDSSLLPEVATHFAKVADACGIDMMYFDGSELLQGSSGDHWYYNAKLQKAFYDAVKNKNMLMQGSSYSPFSWHQLARSASADGHGDLKGYLDQRSPGFLWMQSNGMPLDIGWYYAYDKESTIDMYEYILGTTLGYDSSMSLQVSVSAAHAHPFMGELLDKINRYEQLRLSGRMTPEQRERFRIDPKLGGKKPEEIQTSPELRSLRKEYRLLGEIGKERFQRVIYTPWQTIDSSDAARWTIEIPLEAGAVRVGLNIHRPEKSQAGSLANPFVVVYGKRLEIPTSLDAGQYVFHWPGENVRKYGSPPGAKISEAEKLPPLTGDSLELPPGKHEIRFGHAGAELGTIRCRARLTLLPKECFDIP